MVDNNPRLQRLRDSAGDIAKQVGDAMPDAFEGWTRSAVDGTQSFLTRTSRVGLTPEHIVRKHTAAGHDVGTLGDVRSLDLELVDKVRGRNLDLGYAGFASATGAGTAAVLTGGTITASTGAAAAPGTLAVVGAIAADAAAVLVITSRAVGHIALSYGYDPEDPAEKLIIRAVINVGAATTATTRIAALQDLSRLTQLLYRGAPWAKLNESIISRALTEFAKQFGKTFTKRTLGKAVPFVGIGISAMMNWATVESIIDDANRAYRHRFLTEKYPQLAAGEILVSSASTTPGGTDQDGIDQEISIVEIVEDVLDDEASARVEGT
ncbi:EcsC family protein [Promicromonospora xylanilytica]